MAAENVVGGIEGGATHSNCVLVDTKSGRVIGSASGPDTNHHLLGMEECWRRLADIIDKAKDSAGIPRDEPLLALGLSLSGCEEEQSNARLAAGLGEFAPRLAARIAAGSDVEGSAAAATAAVAPGAVGGVALIAGTGHNCLRVGPGAERRRCGGWGNILGDEGSAYVISFRSVKICFDELDKFKRAPFPIDRLWALVKEHFGIEKQADILDAFYGNFDKAFIASMCKKVAELANEGDELARFVFRDAGTDLARSVRAVLEDAPPEMTSTAGGVPVLCVGSVWLSWPLLRPGFEAHLVEARAPPVQLLRLQGAPLGIGAAMLAVQRLGLPPLPKGALGGVEPQVLYRYGGCRCKQGGAGAT